MDDTRKRCIRETIALCSGQGLGFTMSELAARLGMSKKTLYVLFESKEALLLATVDSMFDEVKVSEAEILARRDLSLAEKIRRLVVVLPDSYQTLDWTRLQGVEEKYPVVYRPRWTFCARAWSRGCCAPLSRGCSARWWRAPSSTFFPATRWNGRALAMCRPWTA